MAEKTRIIGIIGAGQIGSRHLQAIAKLTETTNIYIVDTSTDSLNIAKQRFKEIVNNEAEISTSYLTNQMDLPAELDIVIVSTNSNIRAKVIEKLLENKKVRYLLLEKVLFQSSSDYENIASLLKKHRTLAWVNCPKRIWPTYQKMFSELKQAKNLHMIVNGSNIGLGCNTIHYIDLMSFFTNETNIKINSDLLESEIIQSKRSGFIELTGTLRIETSNNSTLTITSYNEEDIPFIVFISSDVSRYIITESDNKMLVSNVSTNWKWTETDFITP
ncbi:MAG: Inositol 2-dehydrogenase/D-chiro-inositol 3-dehydrogenase, partial [Candidatus Heimdallarchaeota archaeon LC_2]